jgi:tetratricopeptide (TPR) repeat protein/tRNA A-37 threonylcarbamoyl transferase component Bud32
MHDDPRAPDDPPDPRPASSERASQEHVEQLVAACIEALERGETDPAPRVCAAQPELLSIVARRLSQLVRRGLLPGDEPLPERIGRYRVLRELGSGGMGSVYLAEQTEPVHRRVALKVVKLGMDTREVLARFRAERQALALMSHPHIAQVYDAGMTGEGRPYFAMEYVEGEPLTKVCDERRLPARERVALMVTVCRAVQHAHDRGFIHRDLKPSNVLVVAHGGELTPKIIDFGIAKATGPASASEHDLRTRADQMLGTPEYMSPEQMQSGGLDVDTRTDVYSLGATLYELLCGELPFDSRRLRHASRLEMERILRDELPAAPSRRLSQADEAIPAARRGARTTVARAVAGELDWITLCALQKPRELRYRSALALAEDLERWLRGEPVQAAPPGRTYRLRKFVRRHRIPVAAAAAVLLSLIAGLIVSLRATADARAAQQREASALADVRVFYGLARDAVGNLVGVADASLKEVPQADAVRRQMMADAIEFYHGLLARQPGDLELRIDLARAQGRIGVLQQRLGQTDDAVATLRAFMASLGELRGEAPLRPELALLEVEAHDRLASALFADGQVDAGRAELQAGLRKLQDARAQAGPLAGADAMEGTLLANLATHGAGGAGTEVTAFVRSLAAFDRAGELSPAEQRMRAWTAARCAEALTRQNRLAEAAEVLADAAERLRALAGGATTELQEGEAQIHEQCALVLRRLDRTDEARASEQAAIAIWQRLAAEHPEVLAYPDGEAGAWHFLAQLELSEARPDRALPLVLRATEIRARLARAHPQDQRQSARWVRSLINQADVEMQLWQNHGGPQESCVATLERATEVAGELLRQHGDDLESLLVFSAAYSTHAAVLAATGRAEEALRGHERVREELEARLPRFETSSELHYSLVATAINLLKAHYIAGQFAEAVAAGERGLRHVDRGLELDARYEDLIEQAIDLCTTLAIAQFKDGDREAGMETLLRMCDRSDWGPAARELACLLLGESIREVRGHARHREWQQRAATELRDALAARGSIDRALARPPQISGISQPGSRLRDLDLRLVLADLLQDLGESDEQRAIRDEALRIVDSMPDLDVLVARHAYLRRADLALNDGEPDRAVLLVDRMLGREGAEDGGRFLIAAVLTRCATATEEPERREALAQRAVAFLRDAIDGDEVPRDAALRPDFEPLRDRADYRALLAR